MRKQTAKELLTESFRELAEHKGINRITVKEIVQNCGYSTATFYRHFQDKYDLISWDYRRGIRRLMQKGQNGGRSCAELFADIAAFYEEQRPYFRNLLVNTYGLDSFLGTMTEINYANCVTSIEDQTGRALSPQEKLCLRTYIDGTVLLSSEWILGRFHASVEEMSTAYAESWPALLSYPAGDPGRE